MNLHSLLLEREAAGRPVTVGLIGAGKFGTMFLAQARLTRGSARRRRRRSRCRARATASSRTAGWPAEQFAAASLGDALRRAAPMSRADAQALIAHPAIEVIVEATGIPEAGILTPQGDRARQAHRHGQRRGRRVRGPAAGAQGQGGRRGLQPRLGRPAGADLRARRLGARRGLQGGRGRQGHALRAALSPLQSRQCLGHPRQVPQHHRPPIDQPEDVQLVRRRHQVGHRDDRGVQRHRPAAAVRGPGLSAGDALRARRGLQAEERRRHAGEGGRHRGDLIGLLATAATCRTILRSAPMW